MKTYGIEIIAIAAMLAYAKGWRGRIKSRADLLISPARFR